MKYAIYNTQTGEIRQTGNINPMMKKLVPALPGEAVYFSETELRPYDKIDLVTKLPITGDNPGDRPTLAHRKVGNKWEVDPALLGRLKRQELIQAREDRIFGPIEFQGATWDATVRALNSMRLKTVELEWPGLEVYPGLLVWVDHHNKAHTFASPAEMRAFLVGLQATISRRRTEAYEWSRKRKADLAKRVTVEHLEAFKP